MVGRAGPGAAGLSELDTPLVAALDGKPPARAPCACNWTAADGRANGKMNNRKQPAAIDPG